MPSDNPSKLHQILKTVRMLAVLVGAAVGLALESPWHVLAFRLVLLWAALYLTFGLFEVLVQFLSARAAGNLIRSADRDSDQSAHATSDASMK
jgi:hypothetical protein